MKLEAGKRYVLRNGSVTSELVRSDDYDGVGFHNIPWAAMVDGNIYRRWNADGSWCSGMTSGFDIVQEYALGHKDAENTANRDEALAELAAEGQRLGMYDTPAVRQFSTGATRNLDHNKLDYEGFNCPMAQRAFAEYMHGHRKQADGTIRDSDNWQRGMDFDVYAKSLVRHVHDLHCLHRGWTIPRPEDGQPMTPDDEHKLELLCAIWFNVQGYIHELLKAKVKCESSSAG